MNKLILVSNRLPVTVQKTKKGVEFKNSIGGLATGLNGYHNQSSSTWVGWLGLADEEMSIIEKKLFRKKLNDEYKCQPVFLSQQDIDLYYYHFCNKTIWPLFHYFKSKTEYEFDTWEAYVRVNRKFFDSIAPIIDENDTVWIHDYHLMLLPQMIKEEYPHTRVGFFLHIPFPSFEVFRMLIWREQILKGLLGADLIGFHTYDYVQHFLSSVRRLLGLEHNFNKVSYEDRYVLVDAFPMGIDYEYFFHFDPKVSQPENSEIFEGIDDTKIILSIDRLDYTKGIPERIRAFGRFLAKYPQYHEKIRLYLIVAPSREGVDTYDELKKEIEKLVSKTNGRYGTFKWMPIWFFFRSFSQSTLIHLYRHADVMLVTPLRDGMNLVAKEYIAARHDYEGMLVISETAGAASELGEAVIVNANNYDAIALGIKTALDMPRDEKIARNKLMHKRLQRYDVKFWANEFLDTLNQTGSSSVSTISELSMEKDSNVINHAYLKAKKRVLFLDYDGTLVGFKPIPEQAKPDGQLKWLLRNLANDPKNTVVIVSGRDRFILDKWLGDLNLHILAEHGLWVRYPGQNRWNMTTFLDNDWKDSVRHILELFTYRMPGSFIEEKEYSLAWHYRQCEPDSVAVKLSELKEALMSLIQSTTLGLQEGNKVLEIKDSRVNKGYVSSIFMQHNSYDFVLGAGDDYTDEDLFLALPPGSFSIKIGIEHSNAKYHLRSWQSMRTILKRLVNISNDMVRQGYYADQSSDLSNR
jgi:trehalose 6-phosphate synthase/phosphatase